MNQEESDPFCSLIVGELKGPELTVRTVAHLELPDPGS